VRSISPEWKGPNNIVRTDSYAKKILQKKQAAVDYHSNGRKTRGKIEVFPTKEEEAKKHQQDLSLGPRARAFTYVAEPGNRNV
jgi:hypothetical protein